MTNKNTIDTSSAFDEFKDSSLKHGFSKFEFDLYHEEHASKVLLKYPVEH